MWFFKDMRNITPEIAFWAVLVFLGVCAYYYLRRNKERMRQFNATVAREFGRTFCDEK